MDEGSGIRIGGLATGLDTAALIEALLRLERRPLDLIQTRRDDLDKRQELFRELNTKLLALRDASREIDNQNPGLSGATLDEEFLAFTAASNDEGVVTATATGNAAVSTTPVRVLSLATVGRRITSAFASATDTIATAGNTLTIDFGGESPITVTAPAGGASLQDLRNLVNSSPDNLGEVRAEVLFDGAEYRMVLSGAKTGIDNDITVTTSVPGPGASPFLDAALTQNAADARLEVLGIEVTRPGNDIEDVVPGVTLRLHGTTDELDPSDLVEIQVTRDDEAMAGKLEALASAYNDIREFVIDQAGFNEETKKAGLLSGDSTVRGIERQLQRVLSAQYNFDGNPLSFLGEVGLTFDRTGKLNLDRDRMASALDQDPIRVRQLLAGDGTTDGLATAVGRILEPITRVGDGTLALREDTFEDRLADIDRQIERFEARLGRREEGLVRTFTSLESTVARLQAQAGFLGSIVSFR